MVGISSAVFGKQPQVTTLRKNSAPRELYPNMGQGALLLQRDEVHFAGRRKRTPTPSESDSEDGYLPSDTEDSQSQWTSSSLTEESKLDSLSEKPPSGGRYNLRKRPKPDGPSFQKPVAPESSLTATSTPPRRVPDVAPASDDEGLRLLMQASVKKALADFIKTPWDKRVNGPDWSDSDSDDDRNYNKFKNDKTENNPIKVISYKQSPFGSNAERLGFKRIAGMEGLKSDLNRLLVDQIQNPQLYKDYGLENSASGMLLYGPPGNGKTFFAKAVAEEAGANFLEIYPSTIGSPFIHETSKFIGESFDAAAEMAKKTKRPTVLLIDEVDAMAPQQGGDSVNTHHNEEVAEFLNQLNECAQKNVFVVATTNLPAMLDPALVRSGRMNAKIYVGAPDEPSRKQVLDMYLKQRSAQVLADGMDVGNLAGKTHGYSIADLKELVNQASRFALEQREKITEAHFSKALKKVHPSVSDDMAESYKQMIAKFEVRPERDTAWKNMYI